MALAAAANAQTTSVDIRLVEQTGQAQVVYSGGSSPDPVLDLAVQIRVNGGSALGGFGFDVVILGEPDTNGTLGLNMISNADRTYSGLPPVPNAVVGRGGLAATYTYLAAINGAFNGKINMSSGEFTHSPANSEIGLVIGPAIGGPLMTTPGLDPNEEGNPGTWSGYGLGFPPTTGAVASIDPTLGSAYLAQGQFIDVYRFRYTVTNFSNRTLHLTLQDLRLQTAPQFIFSQSNGWGLDKATWAGAVTLSDLMIPLVTAPQGTCCGGANGACVFGAEFECASPAVWTAGGACLPNPCPQTGTCCDAAGVCSFGLQPDCPSGSAWSLGGACSPNPCPQPGVCCDAAGLCSFGLQPDCPSGSAWSLGGACSPNPCPQPGACCDAAGLCSFGLQADCLSGSTWTLGGACSPNPCPQPGVCCDAAGLCSFGLQADCLSGSTWTLGGACSPNLCPQPGACCLGSICEVRFQADCTGQFSRFAGAGLACNASGNTTTPCCSADFNGGGLGIQDIFDFLNAWLANDPRTDLNGDGIQVADIFAFLNAWFAGCS